MSDKLKISFIIFILALLPFLLMANNKILEDVSIRRNIDLQVINLLKTNNIQEDTTLYEYNFRIAETKDDVDNEGYTKQFFEITKGEKNHIWAYKISNGTDVKYIRIIDKPNTSYELSTNYSLNNSFVAMSVVYVLYLFYLYSFAFKRKVSFKTIFGSGFMYFVSCSLTPIMIGTFTYTNGITDSNLLKVAVLNQFLFIAFFNATMVKYFNDLFRISSLEERWLILKSPLIKVVSRKFGSVIEKKEQGYNFLVATPKEIQKSPSLILNMFS